MESVTSISDAGADLGLVSRALPDEERAADVELVVHEEALGVRPRDGSEIPSVIAISGIIYRSRAQDVAQEMEGK